MPREPETREELRQVALIAAAYLLIDGARAFGVVTGGPIVNVDRCQEIIDRAEGEGIMLGEGEVDATLAAILVEEAAA